MMPVTIGSCAGDQPPLNKEAGTLSSVSEPMSSETHRPSFLPATQASTKLANNGL